MVLLLFSGAYFTVGGATCFSVLSVKDVFQPAHPGGRLQPANRVDYSLDIERREKGGFQPEVE